ncbi:hypothetical protein NEUTE1DRAFT_101672 [Neurospora tetrasperma FGSC 2508]|uniref:Uncharacterized protein n=1 Tax=Neurospora tetrasperma (strain FGSC 2508 / ATCC MYA-4615 / P0657) TaxID=510951 RepID=F8MPW2_NEUT8|nr:uncharacterized protein NEUTE1DRAFT_101672 [Neurospora tetrasperma FGSC 2508]EGO56392.1 hypothetical protein NEUTE1DRAFT_101672 [Neurospora tetrasperma FGSC 2508]
MYGIDAWDFEWSLFFSFNRLTQEYSNSSKPKSPKRGEPMSSTILPLVNEYGLTSCYAFAGLNVPTLHQWQPNPDGILYPKSQRLVVGQHLGTEPSRSLPPKMENTISIRHI